MKRLLRLFEGLDRGIGWGEAAVLSLSVMALALVSIANVIGRNLLDHSLAFTQEVNQSLMVLITFVGIGYGARRARHIRMSALHDQLRGRWRKALLVFTSVGTAALLFFLAWYAVEYVAQTRRIGSVTPALQIPLWAIYLWVPIGFTVGGIQYLLAALRNLTTPGAHLAFNCADEYENGGEGR